MEITRREAEIIVMLYNEWAKAATGREVSQEIIEAKSVAFERVVKLFPHNREELADAVIKHGCKLLGVITLH